MKKILTGSVAILAITSTLFSQNSIPNIVVIMCDDLGFSDLGCYGGEMKTPNIDQLAKNGIRFTQFKNTGRSCPSRASLLTGHYPHKAEMGWMTAVDEQRPGYRGQISANLPTIAEILKQNGYATYMSGKWHVTVDSSFDTPNGSYPTQRGFDRYYGSLSGGGSYYTPTPLYSNLKPIKQLPDDYYYTQAITDSAVQFIKQHPVDKPMFCYIAHYAPHLPLEAPKEYIEQRIDRYKEGFDKLRKERFERLKQAGIIDPGAQIPLFTKEFNGKRPKWEDLTQKQQEKWVKDMATYAAMVEIMDEGIGKVIETLKEQGIYDRTVIMFLSDNGSTYEGGYIKQLMADLSNTPYRSYKCFTYNGGISTPFIISNLKNEYNNSIIRQPAHIIDLFPTCLELARAQYPKTFNGNSIKLEGETLVPYINKGKNKSRDLYFEHQTSCAIISKGWKLVRLNGKKPWELYNLTIDPFETNDLSKIELKRVKKLEKKWTQWAENQNIFPFEYRDWSQRINYYSKPNKQE